MDPSFLLLQAVLDNDLDLVRKLVQEGADVNELCRGTSSLHEAITEITDNLGMVKFLIEHGADASLKNSYGQAPLNLAPHGSNRYAICKLLLENGANPNDETDGGVTPLHKFLQLTDSLEDIKLLLDYQADIAAVDEWGQNALHYAARNTSLNLVEFLVLDHGLDVEFTNADDQSVLHIAAEWNTSSIYEFLLKHNAKVNRRDRDHCTPLFYAVRNVVVDEPEAVVEVLLKYSAVLFDESTNWSALKTTLEFSKDSMPIFIVQKLAERGFLGLSVSDDDRRLIENNDVYKKYYEEHFEMRSKEVQEMKDTKFYNNVSLFNILMGSRREICGYARNEELLEALKKNDCESRFSIYVTPMMKMFLAEVKRQRSLKDTTSILSH